MNSKLFSKTGLVLLAITVLFLTVIANHLLRGARVDLTEDHLYTLSSGTENILKSLTEPVTLKFYFSRSQTNDVPQIRNYARRIQELLQEYVLLSGGKLNLEVVDPESFSEQEDEAAGYGLQAVPVSRAGQTFYMGLVALGDAGENTDKGSAKKETIRFLSPDKERFLEYDVSNLIYNVTRIAKPKLGLMSTLPVSGGGYDMATRQPQQPWMSVSQLEKLYKVENLSLDTARIPDDISLLVLIQPDLKSETRYAVDQYVLKGGHVLVFLDPYAETAGSGMPGMAAGMGENSQSVYLDDLLNAWGIEMVKDRFVADDKYALTVGNNMGRPVRHLGILGYGKESFNAKDIVTSNLKNVNLSSAGALTLKDGASIVFEPLLQSSQEAALLDTNKLSMMFDPKVLFKDFQPSGEQYTIAARVTGKVKTAFPDGRPKSSGNKGPEGESKEEKTKEEKPFPTQLIESEKPANIILFADTDVLSNRLWVQVSQFFGQHIANPFANNGDMMKNMVDNLMGHGDLISIRSRGQFSRPFTQVDEVERRAQARFMKTEEELNLQLQATESRLMELQRQKQGKDAFVMSAEQTQEVAKFKQEKLKIRKQLREVQHQLNQDIERLGTELKLINILLVPVLLTVFALFWRARRRWASL